MNFNYQYLSNSNSSETITNGSGRVKNPKNDLKNVQNGHPEPHKLSKTKAIAEKGAQRPLGALGRQN